MRDKAEFQLYVYFTQTAQKLYEKFVPFHSARGAGRSAPYDGIMRTEIPEQSIAKEILKK